MTSLLPTFQAGSPLRPDALYVERPADRLLPDLLRQGQLCYVLAPRQMGKSSLCARVAQKLTTEGLHCVLLDLTAIGGQTAKPPEWYFGLLSEIANKLPGKQLDPSLFWETQGETTNAQRFINFLSNEVLLKVTGRVLICIDEIDAVRALPFNTDEFFAAIRAIHISPEPIFRRLTFCLLGVAQPRDLIERQDLTPFNVGSGVPLNDFTREEAEAFLPGLASTSGDKDKLLDAVYSWTSGHPYMMQRLCDALVNLSEVSPSPSLMDEYERVNALVRELFLQRGQATDSNLGYAAKKFERKYRTARTASMLELYGLLLQGREVAASGDDGVQGELLLTGMITIKSSAEGNKLAVRNRIFESFFDAGWVKEQQKDRLFAEAMRQWLESGRDARYLLRTPAALQEAEKWAAGREDLTRDEQQFLRTCLQAQNREQRVNARTRLALAILIVLIPTLFMVFIFYRRARQADQLELLSQLERISRVNLLARQQPAQLETLVLAIEAIATNLDKKRPLPPGGLESLIAAASAPGYPATPPMQHIKRVNSIRFSPDNQTLLTASDDGIVRLWDSKTGIEKNQFKGHAGEVHSAVFSPDGETILSGGKDGTARLWATRTGKQILLKRHDAPLIATTFSSKGRFFLTLTLEGVVRVWDSSTGNDVSSLIENDSTANLAVFSPDESQIATAHGDCNVRLWNVRSGRGLHLLGGHGYDRQGSSRFRLCKINSIVFSSSGRIILTASSDGTARLWDASDGSPIAILKGHEDEVLSARFDNEETYIVTASRDSTSRVWIAATGEILTVLRGHEGEVVSAEFSQDGKKIVTAGSDWTARTWDADSGKEVALLRGHGNQLVAAKFSSDVRKVATASLDGTARMWIIDTGKEHKILPGHSDKIFSASISPDGKMAITASADATARLWNLDLGTEFLTLRGHKHWVYSAVFSPDGKCALTTSGDRTARLWRVQDGNIIFVLKGHTDRVTMGVFSSDGKKILTASWDGSARIWDAQSGKVLIILKGHLDQVTTAVFSPDGKEVLTASLDGTSRLWNALNGQELLAYRGHASEVNAAIPTSDWKRALTVSDDRTGRLWELATGKERAVLGGHSSILLNGGFSPDGKIVVTTSGDGIARLWNSDTGSEQSVLRGHTDRIYWSAFSPDGRMLITAGRDKTARLWDVKEGKALGVLLGHNAPVRYALFSPDSQTVLTVSEDKTARIYSVELGYYISIACRILRPHRDSFSRVERYCSAVY